MEHDTATYIKIISDSLIGVAGLFWTISSFWLNKREKEQAREKTQFLQTIFEKEDRQSKEIEGIKKAFEKMHSDFNELKFRYIEERERHAQMLVFLKETMGKVEATLAKHQEMFGNFGRIIFKDK